MSMAQAVSNHTHRNTQFILSTQCNLKNSVFHTYDLHMSHNLLNTFIKKVKYYRMWYIPIPGILTKSDIPLQNIFLIQCYHIQKGLAILGFSERTVS